MALHIPDQSPTILPVTRRMPTLGDAIGNLSETLAGRQQAQQSQQNVEQQAKDAQTKARASALLDRAKTLTPDQWREVRTAIAAHDPDLAPYLPDMPQYTPSADDNFAAKNTAGQTAALDTMPQSAWQQSAYQRSAGAAMPAASVAQSNAQDVYANKPAWATEMQGRQGVMDKTALDAGQKQIDLPQANARIASEQASAAKTRAETKKIGAETQTIAPRTSGALGEEFLKTLDPSYAAIVKGVAENKLDPTRIASIRNPKDAKSERIRLVQDAMQYNPNYDETIYGRRSKAQTEFSSGMAGRNIRSLNTAVSHIARLKATADALKNRDIPVVNWVGNVASKASGEAPVTNFQSALTAVTDELATLFKGTAGTDEQIKQWRKSLSENMSPDQFKGQFDTLLDLVAGRLGALQDQYHTASGTQENMSILSPQSKKILKSFGVDPESMDSGITHSGTTPESNNTVKRSDLEALAKKEGKPLGQLLQEAQAEGLRIVD